MSTPTLKLLQQASDLVHQHMLPTPQHHWPQLSEILGTELWVKHENHTTTGAFKVRGGITFLNWLIDAHPTVNGIVTATRGNHGQSIARAANAVGVSTKIIVPHGNSVEKNIAMRTFGAEVLEHGNDFDEAKAEAIRLAEANNLFIVPAYHEQLVLGVASYAMELFSSVRDLDVVFVPIGCGSGICGLIKTRDALGLKTEIIGVVSTEADAAKRFFDAGYRVETTSANTFADGMAVRTPVPEAFDVYSKGASRIVSVTDDEIAHAMRLYFSCTHNVAEGSGAASLAAAIQQKKHLKGKKVGVILTGSNIDTELFRKVLNGQTPVVG
jgi:threonine dehydratase